MKFWKLHTLVFRCPCCGNEADYAVQIVDGPTKGTLLDPAYWCEKCSSAVRARDTWIFGAVYGPLMAIVATFSMQAVPAGAGFGEWPLLAFAAVCCAIVGWPLSRVLSRHLISWEPRNPRVPQRSRLPPLRDDE